jgi:outer membrane protein
MRKMFVVCCLFGALAMQAGAQQLTRFAVLDLDKVQVAFFKDSKAYRDFTEQSTKVQAEIDKRSKEIRELRASLQAAQGAGDRDQVQNLTNEINVKGTALTDYHKTKTAELEELKKGLISDAFYKAMNNELRFIAESEGYTMVLNIRDDSILWYSQSVDITDKLIQNLRSKR